MYEFRCASCGMLLGKISGKAEIKCRKCGKLNYFNKAPPKIKYSERQRAPID